MGSDRHLQRIERIVVHHSATPRATTYETIERIHTAPVTEGGRGFVAIAYHFVILEGGTVRVGRRLPKMGAHARGANPDSIGICVVGDNTDPAQSWNAQQIESLRNLVAALRIVWPKLPVCGHRDVGSTACPGAEVLDFLEAR